ncbi:unnamed protein product [Paramecium sonneborni]|uniref:Uncharacterized protein n=1 Tax=Paramecium sonneborni TaxID=65129 RepID=A0A8S1K770_9CILI|nr:unnamed protein product [Paramecium sonneborni]
MGQICKQPSTPELNQNSDDNNIKQMTQQAEIEHYEEEIKISEQNYSFLPSHQISMQLSCTPEFGMPPQQIKLFSQQDSQYTPEFLAISQPFQQQMNIYQQQF